MSEAEVEQNEESYFISMTDIMVGMLFVFIILLMYFAYRIQDTERTVPLSQHLATVDQLKSTATELEQTKRRNLDLEAELEKLRQNPLERYLKQADATRETILYELQRSLSNIQGIADSDVKVIPEQGILRLSGDMLFPPGKSMIVPGSSSEAAVKSLAAALAKVLPCFSVGPASYPTRACNPNAVFIDAVFVEGHTDNTPIWGTVEGNIRDNLSLSGRRAINTVQTIYAYQPRLGQMFSISPSVEGKRLGDGTSPLINPAEYGETRPAFPNDTDEGKKSNRRIDLRVLMFSPRSDSLNEVQQLLAK
jgi:outer membrane protein OmpA-like peptidoglycan-associated protein